MVQNLVNPPQGDEYRPLPGSLFPQEYPFDQSEIFSYSYFWRKYYLTQRNFFAIAKRPHYVNYEALCNLFAARIIDYSEAEVYELKPGMSQKQLEEFLLSQNEFTEEKFQIRQLQMEALSSLEEALEKRSGKASRKQDAIKDRQSLTFEEVASPVPQGKGGKEGKGAGSPEGGQLKGQLDLLNSALGGQTNQ